MKCRVCNKTKDQSDFPTVRSPFYPSGKADVCFSCLQTMVDLEDLNQVNRLCQFLNLAFLPGEWVKIYKREGASKAIRYYSEVYCQNNYITQDWSEANERLIKMAKEGVEKFEIEELKESELKRLQRIWGESIEPTDLMRMEAGYNQSLQDFAAEKEAERDLLRKMVRISTIIDRGLESGKVEKELFAMYDKLYTQVTKTLASKESSGFSALSEITSFLERNGFQPQYYDGIPKSEADIIIEDIKEYLRDLVAAEVNFSEMVERALQKKHRKDAGEEDADWEEVDRTDNADDEEEISIGEEVWADDIAGEDEEDE